MQSENQPGGRESHSANQAWDKAVRMPNATTLI